MNGLLRHPAFFPATTTLSFVLAILTGVLSVGQGEGFGLPWMPLIAKSLLTLAFLMLAAWFLAAFTRVESQEGNETCQAEQRASMFRFAYMFSLFSFALLVLPFVAMLRTHESPPDAGPIRLLRACVVLPAAARPASGVAGPVDLCPDPIPPGTVSYPWLVAVGGVIAQECGKGGFDCSRQPAGQAVAAAAAPSAPKGAAGDTDKADASPPLYSVRGGFVVPFYVVVFSFVGGVVNLTRRVPEYQKRSACTFKGTPTETPVSMLEAREFVVFQLMQLLSSPFVAMVAYYALEPKSITSAVGLAFVSGFATESVLLLIRGAVNGLRPETTKTTAAAAATAQLHVVVKREGGAAVDKARVLLRRLPTATSSIKEAVVDAGGAIEFKDLSPGTVWVVATLSAAGEPPLATTPKKVDLVAGQTESTEVTLP